MMTILALYLCAKQLLLSDLRAYAFRLVINQCTADDSLGYFSTSERLFYVYAHSLPRPY